MRVVGTKPHKKAPGQIWLCLYCLRFWSDDRSVATMEGRTDVQQDPHGLLVCTRCDARLVLYNRGERA